MTSRMEEIDRTIEAGDIPAACNMLVNRTKGIRSRSAASSTCFCGPET